MKKKNKQGRKTKQKPESPKSNVEPAQWWHITFKCGHADNHVRTLAQAVEESNGLCGSCKPMDNFISRVNLLSCVSC